MWYISNGVLYVDQNPVNNLPFLVKCSVFLHLVVILDIDGNIWWSDRKSKFKKINDVTNIADMWAYAYSEIAAISDGGLTIICVSAEGVETVSPIITDVPKNIKMVTYSYILCKNGDLYVNDGVFDKLSYHRKLADIRECLDEISLGCDGVFEGTKKISNVHSLDVHFILGYDGNIQRHDGCDVSWVPELNINDVRYIYGVNDEKLLVLSKTGQLICYEPEMQTIIPELVDSLPDQYVYKGPKSGYFL